jgi:short-subunit dehydrogenase
VQIRDHVFVVTGASSGIGLEVAKQLTAAGGKVALFARSGAALASLSAELAGSLAVTVDVTDFVAFRAALAKVHGHYGRIDGLINNAGRSYGATIEEIDPAIFDEVFHLNVLAPIVGMQAVIPYMRAQGGGCVVNINSGTTFMTIPGYSVYGSSKRALMGFSDTARLELEKDRIVVSSVYPAVTATNFGVNRMGNSLHAPKADYSKGDSAAFVAEFVVKAVVEGEADYFVNDYLKKLAGR